MEDTPLKNLLLVFDTLLRVPHTEHEYVVVYVTWYVNNTWQQLNHKTLKLQA